MKTKTAETKLPALDPPRTLTVATYNIHKGLSQFNRRVVLNEVREGLHGTKSDVVFLQEVQGARHRALRPAHVKSSHHLVAQHEFLCEGGFEEVVYGQNATYEDGHHGNAVLSRFPVLDWENIDISHHVMESRGLLHCRVAVPGWKPLHCICVHLGLLARSRNFQLDQICRRIDDHVPHNEPLIMAGDFNDWRLKASKLLQRELGLVEAFEHIDGRPARTFPALLPMLALDRIYVRGLQVEKATCLSGAGWSTLSDHVALVATLLPLK